ncbi:uncharacterized protein V6R79_017357 [Siganus canaliculatus]
MVFLAPNICCHNANKPAPDNPSWGLVRLALGKRRFFSTRFANDHQLIRTASNSNFAPGKIGSQRNKKTVAKVHNPSRPASVEATKMAAYAWEVELLFTSRPEDDEFHIENQICCLLIGPTFGERYLEKGLRGELVERDASSVLRLFARLCNGLKNS